MPPGQREPDNRILNRRNGTASHRTRARARAPRKLVVSLFLCLCLSVSPSFGLRDLHLFSYRKKLAYRHGRSACRSLDKATVADICCRYVDYIMCLSRRRHENTFGNAISREAARQLLFARSRGAFRARTTTTTTTMQTGLPGSPARPRNDRKLLFWRNGFVAGDRYSRALCPARFQVRETQLEIRGDLLGPRAEAFILCVPLDAPMAHG